MIMNASIASFYIIIGTFDGLVTFIGTVLNSSKEDKCVYTKSSRHIGVPLFPPSCPRNFRPPSPRKRFEPVLQDVDLQSHHFLPFQ